MAFVVKPDRKYSFEYEYQDGEWVKLHFDFPMQEDIDYKKLKHSLKDISKKDYEEKMNSARKKIKNGGELTSDEFVTARASTRLHTKMLRMSLVNWEGFNLPDGKPVKVLDKSGHIIEGNQKAIFNDFILGRADLLDKINTAFGGELSEKNLKLGLQPVSDSAGVQANAMNVKSKVSAKDADTLKE